MMFLKYVNGKWEFKYPLLRASSRIHCWLRRYKEVVWLIGAARSGTSWVARVINHKAKYREMFEPFHPHHFDQMNFLLPHQYARPNESNEQLKKAASEVFSGKYTNPSFDIENRSLLYRGLLIKDVFANLLAYWALLRFPNLKIILLIRNPFAVAVSKYKKKDWFWMTDPLDFLKQSNLYEDHLCQFEEIIRRTSRRGDFIVSQILIWSIINYVPLCQFKRGQIHILFYEDMFNDPIGELLKVRQFVHPKDDNSKIAIDEGVLRESRNRYDKKNNIINGRSPITSWENELTTRQIDAGLDILNHFGFDQLYDDDDLLPNRSVITNFHENQP